MSRRLLAIAYHFPPIQGSSGVHRTLAFARYLRDWGWSTTVLTVTQNAYAESRAENDNLIPQGVEVLRAPALDTVQHLAIAGRYFRWMALPDRWQSWIPGGVLTGLTTIRRRRPVAIFSTFPIASAHVIGLILARLTGLPWVADFRDPMDQVTYPADPTVRRWFRWIEQQAFRHATRIIVTTPGTANYYRKRYGEALGNKIRVIPNGFDPEAFPATFQERSQTARPKRDRLLTLLHSGILYPMERNPEPFLRALASMRSSGNPDYHNLRVVFRGSAHETRYGDLIRQLDLADIVSFPPALPYRDAIEEMLAADALLVFQADNCNSQIPAKAYEYLYAGRPIIGITDPAGDTGQLLHGMGVRNIAKLEDQSAIEAVLRASIDSLRRGDFAVPSRAEVMTLSREARTAELARILDEITSDGCTAVRAASTSRPA
jgi:glycosyltransferase involved in cell wall biosynthesis